MSMTPYVPGPVERQPVIHLTTAHSFYPKASIEARQMALNMAVMQAVANGWRVESVAPLFAVVVNGSRPNHILHLLLTMFLCGLWLPIWFIIAISQSEQRSTVTVDEYARPVWSSTAHSS